MLDARSPPAVASAYDGSGNKAADVRARVLFHRCSAAFWGVLGLISFALGWQNSVAMVWLASVYANIKSDWGAAEAADDSAVTERLDRHERMLVEILDHLRSQT